MKRIFILCLVFACVVLHRTPASAQESLRGIALIIGNSAYETLAPLTNPENDAEAIETLLGQLGFETEVSTDRNAKRLKRDLRNFLEDAEEADVALLYYAGHGIEAGGENYMVPVDADPAALAQNSDGLVPLNAYLQELQDIVPVSIILMDACRDNPFPEDFRLTPAGASQPVAIAQAGLGIPTLTRGSFPTRAQDITPQTDNLVTMIGFAAAPGRPALDGEPGTNSPYAAAILRHVGATAGADFSTVMSMIVEEVYLKTNGRQRPWVNQSFRRSLFFGAPETLEPDTEILVTERRELLVHIAALPSAQRQAVETLASTGGVPQDVVYAVMRAAGIDATAAPADIEARLRNEIERFAQNRAARQALLNPDAEILRLSALADQAELEGALKTASHFREQAKARVVSLRVTRAEQIEALKQRILEDAEVYERSAQTNELRFRHAAAAADREEAYRIVAEWDREAAFDYRRFQFQELLNAYTEQADEAALREVLAKTQAEQTNTLPNWTDVQRARFFKFAGQVATLQFEKTGENSIFDTAEKSYESALALNNTTDPREDAVIWGDLAGLMFAKANKSNEIADFERAVVLHQKSLDLLDPGRVLENTIRLFDSAKRDFGSDSAEFRTQFAAMETLLKRPGAVRQFRDWSWALYNYGTTLANLGNLTKNLETEDQALDAFYFSINGFRALGDTLDVGNLLLTQSNLFTRRANRGDTGSIAPAYRDATASLRDLSPETHPVDYYLRMSAVIRLVLEYTEAFDPAEIEAAISYVQNWRAQTSVRALEETGQSLENELGRLNYALASKTDDLTAYRAALEAFVAFEKSPKTAQADIPVAARNQGLALKEIGVLTGELDTLRAAWQQLDRAYHLAQNSTDATQTLLDRGDLEFHISYHSQQSADFAQGAKTYTRLADAIAPADRDVDWAYLMLNKATMLHQFATTNADVAALRTASQAYGAAAEVFATHGTPAEANTARLNIAKIRYDVALRQDAPVEEYMTILDQYTALTDTPANTDPATLADAHANTGTLLLHLAERTPDPALIPRAFSAFKSAIDTARSDPNVQLPYYLEVYAYNALTLGERLKDIAHFREASRTYEELVSNHNDSQPPLNAALRVNNLAYAYVSINRLDPADPNLDRALWLSDLARTSLENIGATEELAYARATSCDAMLIKARNLRDRALALRALELCQLSLAQLQKGSDEKAIKIARTSINRGNALLVTLSE